MSKPGPDSRAAKSRWTRFLLVLGAIVAAVTAYGTIQQRRLAPSPGTDPERGARLLRDLYGDRALPRGWELESVERRDADAFVVTLRFNPPLSDPRYGQPADPATVRDASTCPADRRPLPHAGILSLRLRARDKTGIIAEIDCATADPP